MINQIVTNVTGSYCLSQKSYVSHHIIFITACALDVLPQHEQKRVDADVTLPAARSLIPRFHDRANIEHTSSMKHT